MNTYVVVRSRYLKGDAHEHVNRVQAASMDLKLEESGAVVVLRDEEARMIGVVHDFDAVYLESSVQLARSEETENVDPE